MASAELKELLELAKEAGLEGTELSNFLRDERTRQREREKEERERQEKEGERQREREKEEREREKEEREHHREREKAESDALQREADRRHEIELARLRVEDNVLNRSGQAERNIGSMGSVPKLPSFDEKMDDLDAYLYRFEGYATMQGWPKERWASNLSALLKGNALQVFHRMSLDDSGDYELLKIALLNRYRLTDADFRNKFRQAKPQDGESFSQFGIRITGYLDRWIELSETSLSYEGIRDLLIREQTLGVGSAELRVFIEERTPGSFKEMCNIAEQYLKAHGKSFRHWWMSDKHRSEGHETKGLNSENKNRFSNATSKFHGRSGQARVNGQSNPTAGRACWICSSVKHYARECPQNKPDRPMQSSKSKVGGNATVLACEEALLFKGGLKLTTKQDGDLRYFEDKGGKKYQVKEIVALASEQNKGMITALGRVSGRPDTIEVLRDSGCSTMVIREDLCDPRDFTGETRGCVMMDGRVIEVPVVKKKVDTPYYIGEVEGVAMKAPIYDLVIGNVHGARGQEDPDTSWEIPTGEEITEHEMSVESQDVGPAITSHEKTGGVVTRLQSKNKPLRPMKVAKTKIVNLTSTEFKKLQETDKSLDKLRERLESTCKLAHDELRKAQGNQHKWFNKKAKAKHLKEGDQVLLLLPTKLNKLEMQWQGPFDIIKKVRENDYVINLDGQHKMFHANMLRKYLVRKTIDNGMVILCGCRHLEIATGGMAENDSLEETVTCEERSDDIKYCPLRATQTWKDVKISTDLNDDQQREVRQLLEEYGDVLTDIPGKTNLAECNIELTDDIPFRVKAYPVPYALKREMDKEVSEMMKADIIESSVSEYASSPVVVRKPDGSVRYCIDFRKLNAKTVFDAEPVPNQEVILNRMGGDNFISRLDLTKGFWQVPIKVEDRKYTAFSTDQGLMQFKYMPFGLVNALAIFCRMVRKLLYDVNYVDAYVDDIVPHTATWDDHMHTLREVLQKLRQHGLTAKPSKCEIGHAKLDLLGHVVGGGSIQPQDRKIEKILQMRKPETKKELRSFLGTVGFHQKYIDKYAEKGKALTDLLKKGEPNQIKWDAESNESFQTLKTALTQKPILRLPNFEKQFVLQTDASDSGLGAVLLQEHDGVNMPVMYISRKLNAAETRYSTIERECLALFWATKRLHVYLYGTEFILEIDHQPLAFVNRANINNDRVMRWALHLQMYRYQVRIVKGSANTTADLLSRCGL